MKVSPIFVAFFFALVMMMPLVAEPASQIGDERNCRPPMPVDVGGYGSAWVTDDRNGDGLIDHAAQYDKKGLPTVEAFDFNYDGKMDDFYSFVSGAVVEEVLDSNFDGLIDIWVHVYQGVYVASYERDSNFDGKLDIVKRYGNDKIVKR